MKSKYLKFSYELRPFSNPLRTIYTDYRKETLHNSWNFIKYMKLGNSWNRTPFVTLWLTLKTRGFVMRVRSLESALELVTQGCGSVVLFISFIVINMSCVTWVLSDERALLSSWSMVFLTLRLQGRKDSG